MTRRTALAACAVLAAATWLGCERSDTSGSSTGDKADRPSASRPVVKTSTFRWRPKTAIGAAFAEAKRTGHGVMIDFGAKWCAPCEEMNSRTFSDEGVRKAIAADFIPVQVDVTESTDADEQIQKRYEAMTLPAIIFFAPNGTEIGRVSDFQPPDTFVKSVREFAAARKRG